ncbi:hypothetical protein [Pedobacter montanisoli]|uniref:Uncharacterized protein n=1 Tax=Pedobacter montanisoli TaxID=2923277 RepID=A0ABS9ZSX0_9SPHI|nr:hypothetical protein [Pedobacter montanisoli]MCJ0741700.1 hypothetical protein [Pedobacter montanisoli]
MAFFIVVPSLPAAAMALYPFILVKKAIYKEDKVLVNHEKIHFRQQLELFILLFYLLYFCFYLFNLLKYKKHALAYSQIPFEKEAYQKELDMNYLKNRPFYFWINFLK